MEVYDTAAQLKNVLDAARRDRKSIGLVGTSGAVHDGHLSLIKRCGQDNDVNVLFWGPQKANHNWKQSTISYDRDADRDFALIREAGIAANPLRPRRERIVPAAADDKGHAPGHVDQRSAS